MVQADTFTTSDGCPIAYSIAGPSRPASQRIVLIHSLGLDRSIWNDVVPLLTDDTQVLFYDCRGHGRSGRRAEAFTTNQFARDWAELLDHLG
jgi:3-oxoadipate enol-lactonase